VRAVNVPRANLIVTGYGPKGSGKSALLSDLWVRPAPRVVTLDQTGEAAETYPDATTTTRGLPALLDALRVCASLGTWHVLAALDDAEVPKFFGKLVPPFASSAPSLCAALGGMAIECGEVDMIARTGKTPDEVLSAWRRGRHVGLSLLCATQRPASAARDVSAQADVLFAFQTSETRDVKFIADMLSPEVGEIVRRLPRFHFALYPRREQKVWICDEKRVPYRCLTLDGADAAVAADAIAPNAIAE
jgi:hypothetical protein